MTDSQYLSPPSGKLIISTDPDALALDVGEALCSFIRQRVGEAGCVRIALSGGSTPRKLYQWLATQDIPWDAIRWFWGDERNVPLDHSDSNYLMVHSAMLGPADVPQATVFPVPIDVDHPEMTAQAYEQKMREEFGADVCEKGFPRFDLILLGLGEDAHTASLFPHTTALHADDRIFVENWVPKLSAYRLTLTASAINAARNVWFVIAGAGKQAALRNVWGATENPDEFPSQLVHPTMGQLVWWLSHEAHPMDV